MNAAQRRQFLFAGNAIFTITSKRTGKSFTYKLAAAADLPGLPLFASVLTGPDNLSDYTYIGMVGRPYSLRLTKGSKVGPKAPSFRALDWFLQHLDSDQVEFRHCGRCGRCGRTLTVPSSIDSGLGPECAGKVGVL